MFEKNMAWKHVNNKVARNMSPTCQHQHVILRQVVVLLRFLFFPNQKFMMFVNGIDFSFSTMVTLRTFVALLRRFVDIQYFESFD